MDTDFKDLELISTIGFEGHAQGGLKVHPDRNHILYPLGSTVVIENIKTGKQEFLFGHNNCVSCLDISKSGHYVATGQVTHMGFKSQVIIWDFDARKQYASLLLHKVKVECVAFSPNELYLVTLGSQDDRSVICWDVATKEAICGSPAALNSSGNVLTLTYSSKNDNVFITAGDQNIRVWTLDRPNRKIRPFDLDTQKIKRKFECIMVDPQDEYFYCGSYSGDILKFSLYGDKPTFVGRFPLKKPFSQGVTALCSLANGNILVGGGDGGVCEMVPGEKGDFKKVASRCVKLHGGVTSLTKRGEGHQFFVGTSACNIYRFDYAEFRHEMVMTAHKDGITDLVFPKGVSDLFLTSSTEDIRIWNTKTNKELLRIHVANMVCNALDILYDGSLIISGWNDNTIKAFRPQSGKLAFEIPNAHSKGVTAVASTRDGRYIISGGGEGHAKIWNIADPRKQTFVAVLNEHKGKITCIAVRSDDAECITASTDGSCILWNLKELCRNAMLQANAMFYCLAYHPEEVQVITSGSDRQIGYWEVADGQQIREVEAAKADSINGMSVGMMPVSSHDNQRNYSFVTCGGDKLIKLWLYNQGVVTHVGQAHSTDISKVRICDNMKYIVSVGIDGSIMRWRFPSDLYEIVQTLEAEDSPDN